MNTKKILKESSIPIEDRLYYFKRHLTELRKHLWDIIVEGLDMFNPCFYDDYESYIKSMIHSCAITLINSYDELYGKGDTDEIEQIVTQYIKDNYMRYFNKGWRERECDEDEDTINENKEEIKKDLSPIITNLLEILIVGNNEDVCKIEVVAPWNRETMSGGDYRNYAIKVYFISGPNTKNWPRTHAVRDKEEEIMGQIWEVVYDSMGIATDLYSSVVKKCNKGINESVDNENKKRSNIEIYILRRVPWDEILEGLKDGIEWAERRCQKYGDNVLTAITLERFGNMVMSVLMENILLFLKDEVSQEILHYGATENYLRNLFSDEISKSYNKIIN